MTVSFSAVTLSLRGQNTVMTVCDGPRSEHCLFDILAARVCISGYPLSGYPDISVNFMAAKNPDILK